VASDPVVRRFRTREETGQNFTKYELVEVASAKVDLKCSSKRTRGAKSHSLETRLFEGFASRGFSKL
jgi:hypothetical protein